MMVLAKLDDVAILYTVLYYYSPALELKQSSLFSLRAIINLESSSSSWMNSSDWLSHTENIFNILSHLPMQQQTFSEYIVIKILLKRKPNKQTNCNHIYLGYYITVNHSKRGPTFIMKIRKVLRSTMSLTSINLTCYVELWSPAFHMSSCWVRVVSLTK